MTSATFTDCVFKTGTHHNYQTDVLQQINPSHTTFHTKATHAYWDNCFWSCLTRNERYKKTQLLYLTDSSPAARG